MEYFCCNCQSHFPNEDCVRCRESFEKGDEEWES